MTPRALGAFLLGGWLASSMVLAGPPGGMEETPKPNAPERIDPAFTLANRWDDGKAELSVYDLEVTWQLSSGPMRQKLRPLTLLVKHEVEGGSFAKRHGPNSSDQGSGDEALSAFQWHVLYDVGNTRRSRILHAVQRTLRPLKQSYGSVSWEGSCYSEWRFAASELDDFRKLCFSAEDTQRGFDLPEGGFTAFQVPLLVRSLDFTASPQHKLEILGGETQILAAEITLLGVETLELRGQKRQAEKIVVRYSEPVRFPGAMLSAVAPVETYWRGVEEDRPLLRMEGRGSDAVSYVWTLVESFRSAWWRDDDVVNRLRVIGEVPGVRLPVGDSPRIHPPQREVEHRGESHPGSVGQE